MNVSKTVWRMIAVLAIGMVIGIPRLSAAEAAADGKPASGKGLRFEYKPEQDLAALKFGENDRISIWISIFPADGSKIPGCPTPYFYHGRVGTSLQDAKQPKVVLRVFEDGKPDGKVLEEIPFASDCGCVGGFKVFLRVPSRVPSGSHRIVMSLAETTYQGPWEQTLEMKFENPVYGTLEPDADVEALRKQFPKATVVSIQRGVGVGVGNTGPKGEFADSYAVNLQNDHGNPLQDGGASTELRLGHWWGDNRVFLRPDLSCLPAGAEIKAALLKINLTRQNFCSTKGEGAVKVYLVKKPWKETGEKHLCWNAPWTKPGCEDETDRDTKSIAEVKLVKGLMPGFMRFDVTEGVKLWAAGKMPKEGFMLKVEGTGELFPGTVQSSESDDAPLRPRLIVVYSGGPANPVQK